MWVEIHYEHGPSTIQFVPLDTKLQDLSKMWPEPVDVVIRQVFR